MISKQLEDRCRRLISNLPGLAGRKINAISPLSGGVSSEILVAHLEDKKVCVKFALNRLKVSEEWRAPLQRNLAEYQWLETVSEIAPGSVPELYGYCHSEKGFAMECLADGDTYLWKSSLLEKGPKPDEATRVARILGTIHAATAGAGFDAAGFRNHDNFRSLRLEPYLLFTATKHPGIAGQLQQLSDSLMHSEIALIHGDVSPKNIIFHHEVPVFLDAECATMGDPCFDVAFCLNHLVLKGIYLPDKRNAFFAAAHEFISGYLLQVNWEDKAAIDRRIAALLPALMLARVDGKSPVEYFQPRHQQQVRQMAIPLIASPLPSVVETLHQIHKQVL